jgi:hypothetical protein
MRARIKALIAAPHKRTRARWTPGWKIPERQAEVLANFPHRWTVENLVRQTGGACPECMIAREQLRGTIRAQEVLAHQHVNHIIVPTDRQWFLWHEYFLFPNGALKGVGRARLLPYKRIPRRWGGKSFKFQNRWRIRDGCIKDRRKGVSGHKLPITYPPDTGSLKRRHTAPRSRPSSVAYQVILEHAADTMNVPVIQPPAPEPYPLRPPAGYDLQCCAVCHDPRPIYNRDRSTNFCSTKCRRIWAASQQSPWHPLYWLLRETGKGKHITFG